MLALSSKPIVLQEWGYPTSPALMSSEQAQAAFIDSTFAAWKRLGAERIPFISFFKRRDWNAAHCAALSRQAPGQRLHEFLCSLGLLRNDHTPKPGYRAVVDQIAALWP
jgi:hypothetical protein